MPFDIIFHVQISDTMVNEINADPNVKRFEYSTKAGKIELIDSVTQTQANNIKQGYLNRLVEVVTRS